MMYENLILIYVVVATLAFIVAICVNNNFSNSVKMKGRYMLLGSVLWPFVIIDGVARVLATVFMEIGKTVKENFWDVF